MLAITDHCARCYRRLAADHVLRAGVRHCYGCDLQLLKEQDRLAAAARAARLRRRVRSAHPLPGRSRSDVPVYGIAARRRGHRPAA